MKVKICGITNYEDAKISVTYGADMLGFVFHMKSKRFMNPAAVKSITSRINDGVIKAGVFVDDTVDVINKTVDAAGLTAVQLIGNYPPEELECINARVIKVFRVGPGFNYSELDKFSAYDILLDRYDKHEAGGTGKQFDWRGIPESWKRKVIIAGGISAENVLKIYEEISPAGVDLSSSVEIYPGKKDRVKLEDFFKIVNKLRT